MHGVFGLRITLGRPFPGSLPVVLPTSSPSPLRNSPGFPPGSPRPHRGRTMHVTHVSTCDTQIATRRPPAPCRSRLISPLSQARRARGTLQHVDLGVRPGQYLAPPWQFGSTRHPVPRHVAGTTIPDTSATGTNGSQHRHGRSSTPRRAPHPAKSCAPAAVSYLGYNFVAEKFCPPAQACE